MPVFKMLLVTSIGLPTSVSVLWSLSSDFQDKKIVPYTVSWESNISSLQL